MSLWKTFSLFCLFAAVVACAPKEDSSIQKDPLETGYQLIDKGQYTEAIGHLENLRREDPRPEVREALASAYAARAGLQIETYWSFLVGFQAPILTPERLGARGPSMRVNGVLGQMGGKSPAASQSGLIELANLLSTLELWREKIERVPTLRGPGREDAERALEVLRGNERAGGRLYRALIGLVAFKSDVVMGDEAWGKVELHLQGLDMANPASARNRDILCRIDVGAFRGWATGLVDRLIATGQDVIVAFPSKRPDIERALSQSGAVLQALNALPRGAACR